MSKLSNRQKTASQSEAEGPVVLKDDELETAAGGAPSHSQCEPDDSGSSNPRPSRPSAPSGSKRDIMKKPTQWSVEEGEA